MSTVLYCSSCKRGMGSVLMPTRDELLEALQDAPQGGGFSAFRHMPTSMIEKFVPNDLASMVLQFMVHRCVTCTMEARRGEEIEQEEGGQQNAFGEIQQAERLTGHPEARRAAGGGG